jgi:hypothetical protein
LLVTKRDIDFLQNYLFETETPLPERDMTRVLVEERIRYEQEALAKQQKGDSEFSSQRDISKRTKTGFPGAQLAQRARFFLFARATIPKSALFDVLEVVFDDDSTACLQPRLPEHAE